MLHRLPEKMEFWQGVSGGVEWGEKPFDAATRELREETGIFGTKVVDLAYSFTFPLEEFWRNMYDWGVDTMVAHVFVTQVSADCPITLSPEEHSDSVWCPFERALEMLYWPEDKEALRKAEEYIRMQVR